MIDSHVHLYDPADLPYGWLRGDPVLDRRNTLAEFDAACGPVAVDRLVFVEVAVDRGHHLAEAARAQAWADSDPRIAAIVAHAPVERGEAVEEDLAVLGRSRLLRGVRRLIQGEVDPGMCLAPGFVAGVRAVGRAGLCFDLCVKHWGLVFAAELARRCPETMFVLDHLGKPGIAHGLRAPWWSELRALAASIAELLAILGDRLMYGSDWPVSEQTHRVPDWVALVERAVSGCSAAEREALFGGTAARVYGLGAPADGAGTTSARTAR